MIFGQGNDMLRMNRLLLLFLCMMNASDDTNAGDRTLDDLESLRWQNRVILVYAREPLLGKAIANLEEYAAGIADRDIAWFALDGRALHTNYRGDVAEALQANLLSRYFTPAPADTAVLLIGKDGGVKSRSSDLDLEATFGLIDQMPMRRREMQRKADGSE